MSIICVVCSFECQRSIIYWKYKGPLCAECAYNLVMAAYHKAINRNKLIMNNIKETIHPMTQLVDDTQVYVINHGKAVVVKSRKEKDQHGLPIIVHTLRYSNGKEKDCNYSFIVLKPVNSLCSKGENT